ncbi:MAG: glycerol-3-phosphate 1-O-acyltransferase PlsY [Planctomycetota bacterium]|jgi:glycerol-3-phosphate acyltransferase PlsY
MLTWSACILGAYLVGSIPFGVLIGLAKGVDIRERGSKNIGATNVGRIFGRRLGLFCFALDVGKGAASVLIAGSVTGVLNRPIADLGTTDMWLWLAVAVAAVGGHMYSVFLRFRGGKGVATGFGGLLAMWPLLTLPALGAMIVWYTCLRVWKYVSLASMAAAVSLPFWYVISAIPNTGESIGASLLHASPPFVVTTMLAILVLYKHRANIGRLRRGEEPRVGGITRRGDVLSDPPE